MIYKRILTVIVLVLICISHVSAQSYEYVKGQYLYEISEQKDVYKVTCTRTGSGLMSKNKNILDRQLRLEVVDLIGSYILFKQFEKSADLNFQQYVDEIDLHYTAYLDGLTSIIQTLNGKVYIVYTCPKNSYKIESATYHNI